MTDTVLVRFLRQALPHVMGDVLRVPEARARRLEASGFVERVVSTAPIAVAKPVSSDKAKGAAA